MERRLYFLLPDVPHTRSAVRDLQAAGVRNRDMHVMAGPGSKLQGLPVASREQRGDAAARLENALWGGNLGIFFAALVALLAMAFFQAAWYWLLLPAAVMLLSFAMGVIFTSRVPDVHLDEFRDALRHGEVLLIVDVPVTRVAQVEALLHGRHPEAVAGGISWHSDALRI